MMFTNRYVLKSWAKNYSIFLRKTCFGKEDGFFLPLPATSAAFLGLLIFISSTGLAKGETSLISTGGGDQELPFPVFLKERYRQVGMGTMCCLVKGFTLRAAESRETQAQLWSPCRQS